MKIAGIILILIGIIDVGGSWIGFDLWGSLGILDYTHWLWYWTGYIALGIGFFLYNAAGESDESSEEDPDN